ncbi:MAG TPA: MerR family transcriptional regulator [Longimicrobiales bacterium]|nr:MerR family transcriptional regulator [Longimicrobiales bacterium]
MKGYTTRDVASLLGLTEAQIRAYARVGVLSPGRDSRGGFRFDFQDLVVLRTAAALTAAQVPVRRIGAALAQLRAELPQGRSLTELRIRADGETVVASDAGRSWDARSGQLVMDFDVSELAAQVAPLAQRLAAAAHEEERSAQEWFELGVELEAVAPEEARAAYECVLEREPGHADAHVNMGRLLQETGHAADAAAHYHQALLAGEHAVAAFNLGIALEDLQRTDEALAAYTRAIAADARFAEPHWNLARLHEKRGDRAAALRHYRTYRDLSEGPGRAGG